MTNLGAARNGFSMLSIMFILAASEDKFNTNA